MNNNLHGGYDLFSQPSGPVTRKSVNAVKRTDLCITDEELDTVWVHIKNTKAKTISCRCAYRFPSISPERFTEHIMTSNIFISVMTKHI